jgi:hypothetical protein
MLLMWSITWLNLRMQHNKNAESFISTETDMADVQKTAHTQDEHEAVLEPGDFREEFDSQLESCEVEDTQQMADKITSDVKQVSTEYQHTEELEQVIEDNATIRS